jgi:hypothetical protein
MFEKIKQFFGGIGTIRAKPQDNTIIYTVGSLAHCLIIREYFLTYPLLTYKLVYFQLWCKVLDLMVNKEHLTPEGLLKMVALKYFLPNRLSISLREAFPNFATLGIICPLYKPNFTKINID